MNASVRLFRNVNIRFLCWKQ